jgi:hypothetical protein
MIFAVSQNNIQDHSLITKTKLFVTSKAHNLNKCMILSESNLIWSYDKHGNIYYLHNEPKCRVSCIQINAFDRTINNKFMIDNDDLIHTFRNTRAGSLIFMHGDHIYYTFNDLSYVCRNYCPLICDFDIKNKTTTKLDTKNKYMSMKAYLKEFHCKKINIDAFITKNELLYCKTPASKSNKKDIIIIFADQ